MAMESATVVTSREENMMDSLCRVCGCFSELLIPIFEGEGLENNLPEKIKHYLPIKVNKDEHLPVKICYQCASTVLSWHDLVVNCTDADQKLRNMFKNINDPSKDAAFQDTSFIDSAEVLTNEEMHDFVNEDCGAVPLSPASNMKSLCSDTSLSSKANEPDRTSLPPEATISERFIDLTEDCGEMQTGDTEESHKVSFQFGPQFDHSYTRVPSTKPSPPSKAVNQEPLRSLLYRPILPRPPQTNVTSLQQTSVSTKSSVIRGKEKITGSAPLFLVCTKTQENVQGPSKKAVLVPLKAVQEAVATKKNLPLGQKPKAFLKPQTTVRKPIAPRGTQLNASVSILPVQRSSYVRPVNIKPSVTIMPVPRKTSSVQNRIALKSLLTGEKSVRYTCSVCKMEFLHEVVRRMHMFRSHGIKQYACNLCTSSFGILHQLKVHKREKHASEMRTGTDNGLKYACNMCDSSFLWHRDLLRHKREKHLPPIRSVAVDHKKEKNVVAGVEVSEKEKEMLNNFRVVIDGRDWYHCKDCMKSWKSRDKAILHIRTHTKERMYACEICDQKFNTPGVLRRHLQVHEGKKPFQCEYCDKSFSSKQNRDDHHRFHTKEVKTVCESCGEFLTSASMLYYHRKIHSGVNPYVCPYCNKAYAIRALLKRHIRFHTGEKPHLCSVCGRGFFTSGQLQGHLLVHTDDRPFSCDKCGAKMKSTKYLNRHKAICQNSRKK